MAVRTLKRLLMLAVVAGLSVAAMGPGTVAAAQTDLAPCGVQVDGALCPCSPLCDCQADPFITSCSTPGYRCVCYAIDPPE